MLAEVSYQQQGQNVGEESPLQVVPSMVLGGGAARPAHNFVTKPFNGNFQGIFWNCRSLWARSSRQTIQFTRKLLGSCDFLALAETRQTPERKSELASLFPDCKTFASGIDQYKGGIAIIVKRTFLDMFSEHTWVDTIPGRRSATTWSERRIQYSCSLLGPKLLFRKNVPNGSHIQELGQGLLQYHSG